MLIDVIDNKVHAYFFYKNDATSQKRYYIYIGAGTSFFLLGRMISGEILGTVLRKGLLKN